MHANRLLAALNVKKAKGGVVGNPAKLLEPATRKKAIASAIKSRTEIARTKNLTATNYICDLCGNYTTITDNDGKKVKVKWTYERIAERLKESNLYTVRGKAYTAKMVQLLHKKYCN